jgi:hypothetical protein
VTFVNEAPGPVPSAGPEQVKSRTKKFFFKIFFFTLKSNKTCLKQWHRIVFDIAWPIISKEYVNNVKILEG